MIQVRSIAHAESYFKDALSKTGYYIHGQEHAGDFHGQCAERLNIRGPATKPIFRALCNNLNPLTHKKLTQRTIHNRTVYYDINFHYPKSVTIAYAIFEDEAILSAFQDCVLETMRDIEADAQTRIRKNGEQNQNRITKELLWAEFTHLTARPIDDESVPDPHLHSHCTVFNVTWDEVEQQYKAGQFRDIKRDMPYYQERYYKRLSDRLLSMGYGIRRTPNSFEIEGVPETLIELFSKRTQEINRFAKENNITQAAHLDQLGARIRSKKKKGLSVSELKKAWRKQMQESGFEDIHAKKNLSVTHLANQSKTAEQCIDYALSQCFERASVAYDRRILATAYRYGIGIEDIQLDTITHEFKTDKKIIRVQDGLKTMCTTQEVLKEEKRMIELACAGKGQLIPMYTILPPITLSGDQAEAVAHILSSTDRISNVQGRAGTGKTTTLKELVSHIHNAGIKTTLVAPTANASRNVLRDEGFTTAETVTHLLLNQEMHDELQDGVLIVDEAGLLGVKDMSSLLQLVTDKNARLILFGDTRQHTSVIRGDALRILNTVAGIKAAEINKIYRQRNDCYRKAVEDVAAGNIESAFNRLEEFDAIIETDPENLVSQLVNDYMNVIQKGKTALIVSPTHQQGEIITTEIRKALRKSDLIGREDRQVKRYTNLNYTEAEKSDPRMYQDGYVVQFNQNLAGIKRGSVWKVDGRSSDQVTIRNSDDKLVKLPMDQSQQFTVYQETIIPLSIGDTVAITRGGFDKQGKRLSNGQSLSVVSFDEQGDTVLINPVSKIEYILAPDFGHINHGYTVTSHASQGKTVDCVFISQPTATFAASNLKQFYVSISRARDNVRIYTDDKPALMEQVSEIGDRQSALELIEREVLIPHIAEHNEIPIIPMPQPQIHKEEPKPQTKGAVYNAPKPAF